MDMLDMQVGTVFTYQQKHKNSETYLSDLKALGYDMLYGNSGGYPSYASAAAIILFAVVLTITCINLLVSKKHVHYT